MSLTDHAFGVAGCTACHALRMEYTEKREKNKNVAVNFTRRNNLQPRHFSMLSVSSSESYERVRDNSKNRDKMFDIVRYKIKMILFVIQNCMLSLGLNCYAGFE